MAATRLTFLSTGNPTGLKFTVEHGDDRALFELGIEHSPGGVPFSMGLRPRRGRLLPDLLAVGMAPPGTGVLGEWDGRTHLFVSHLHLDHCALAHCVHPSVPLFYPEAAEDLRSACDRVGHPRWRHPPGTAVPGRGRVTVGAIDVQFMVVDHDLPGAAGFLIRTPDLSIGYTGDHRWHGLHPEVTAAYCEAARGVDVLVQEGVTLGLSDEETGDLPAREHLSEAGVAEAFARLLDRVSGLVVVNLYPMNRERVHAFGAACAACGRRLLLEPQAATIAGWGPVLDGLESVVEAPGRHCVQLSFESLPALIDLGPPPGSVYVHSNGTPLGGFDPAFEVMRSWTRALGLEFVSISSTGHSRAADLERMVARVDPGVVLPVHSRHPEALIVPGVRRLVPESGRPYTTEELFRGSVRPA